MNTGVTYAQLNFNQTLKPKVLPFLSMSESIYLMLPFIPTLLESTFVYLFCFGMTTSAKTVFRIPHEN